eukprot:GHVU01151701.1.p2 GENE.GHVU01151701.1~~GHVU01151701.1.p2  ORF type:complete len:158 (-),score=1.89 GHVU01151701.1:995-1468(-)
MGCAIQLKCIQMNSPTVCDYQKRFVLDGFRAARLLTASAKANPAAAFIAASSSSSLSTQSASPPNTTYGLLNKYICVPTRVQPPGTYTIACMLLPDVCWLSGLPLGIGVLRSSPQVSRSLHLRLSPTQRTHRCLGASARGVCAYTYMFARVRGCASA